MTFNNPRGGIGYAAEFQSSALPFVTSSTAPPKGSPVRFDFPKVSRFITVSNQDPSTSGSISFGFTRNGVTLSNNKFVLLASQTITLELRVTSLYLQAETPVGGGAFSMCAGLTNIDASNMPILSGTNPVDGSSWIGVG